MNADVNRGISLGIEDEPELREKMTNVGEKYNCDLIVYPDVVAMQKDFFSKDIRHYLQMSKGKIMHRSKQTVETQTMAL